MTNSNLPAVQYRPDVAAIRAAAEVARRGADEAARRAGSVPEAVRRLSPATCRQRASQLARFAAFVESSNPASMADAADQWAEARFEGGAAVATVAADIGAVRWFASAAGIEGAASLGAAAIQDARRDGDRRRRGRGQARAISWKVADKIARRAAHDGTKGLRDAALIATASDLCARVSEVAGLRVRDVTTAGNGSGTVEVWQPKTGTARTGYLRASTVRRVRAWTEAAGIGNGSPLFPSMDRWGRVKQPLRAMSPRAVADVIRQRAAASGFDRASGHSLRVGAAVSMAQRGASLVAMQAAGGWKSPDMPAHYGRQASASRGAVATLRPEDRWA
ncbi:MAG: tyrosine-type recombinase/integrase [Gemmatimonadetes bacterium]|nr:tyrosine-type recombinase/integrase [Gemmatimonadota bacterium]